MNALRTLLLSMVCALGGPAQADTLRVSTGEFPPYATAGRPDQGVALSIVRRAFELAGHQVQFTFLPWSRAQAETEVGKWDASAHWGASDERKAKFLLSDNLVSEEWVMLHRRELSFNWDSLEDLQPFSVGIIRDYTYTPAFWTAVNDKRIKATPVPDNLSGLKMLLARRIDVMPFERNLACELLTQHFDVGIAALLTAHPRLMTDTFTTHVIFPKGSARSAQWLADFNQGLKKLKASPEYARLKSNVRCPASWIVSGTGAL